MVFPQSHTPYPPPRFSAAYIAHLGMTTGRVGAFLAIVTSLALPLAVYALPASGLGADGPLPTGVALPLAATAASALVAFVGARMAGRRPLPAAAAMTAGAAAALLSLWLWDGDASALILSALFVGVPALVLVVGSGLVAAVFIWERRRAPGDLARPVLLSLVPLAFVGLAVFLPVMLARAAPEDRGALARLKGRDHQRVQVFQQDGGWVRSWGEFGGGDGQFKNPSGVAVDPGGGVYVVDADNNRVQRFDESGRFELAWGGKGSEGGQLRLPTAIALSREGNVYVSDTGNGRVQVFDPDGAFLGALGDRKLAEPLGVAVDGEGFVYVAEAEEGRIAWFSPDGASGGTWPLEEIDEPARPVGVAVDAAGIVYAADQGNKRIVVYDRSGSVLRSWGAVTGEEDEYLRPTWLTVGGGRVFVVMVDRVYVFDAEGRYLQRWGSVGVGDGRFWGPQGIFVDEQGLVYASQ